MARKLGELGCTPTEARNRLKRILDMGLSDLVANQSAPITNHEAKFIRDMQEAIENNPEFEPSYGQTVYAQDLYDRYIL